MCRTYESNSTDSLDGVDGLDGSGDAAGAGFEFGIYHNAPVVRYRIILLNCYFNFTPKIALNQRS